MSDSVTEADRFIALCADAVHGRGEDWLAEFSNDLVDGDCVISLVGSSPGRSASIKWDESSGFKICIYKPDSHYYESVHSAADAFSRVLMLACD